MRFVIRLFFRTLRRVIGPFLLLGEKLTAPKGIQRDPADQQRVDSNTKGMTLYQYKTCPFCIKVRRQTKRLSLNIETRDAQHDEYSQKELLKYGGQLQVPCLKIEDRSGDTIWIYESDKIVNYLHQQFSPEQGEAIRH